MTDVAAKRRVRHSPLLVAAGLAGLVSAAALGASAPLIAGYPENGLFPAVFTLGVAAIDLFLAGILGWAAFRAGRGGVIGVSVLAIVAAAFVGLFVLDGAVGFNKQTDAQTTAVLFFISIAANALVVMFVALELFLGRQNRGISTSKPSVA